MRLRRKKKTFRFENDHLFTVKNMLSKFQRNSKKIFFENSKSHKTKVKCGIYYGQHSIFRYFFRKLSKMRILNVNFLRPNLFNVLRFLVELSIGLMKSQFVWNEGRDASCSALIRFEADIQCLCFRILHMLNMVSEECRGLVWRCVRGD
jgi:hypothetical protein